MGEFLKRVGWVAEGFSLREQGWKNGETPLCVPLDKGDNGRLRFGSKPDLHLLTPFNLHYQNVYLYGYD
jgi:hypothetical protein